MNPSNDNPFTKPDAMGTGSKSRRKPELKEQPTDDLGIDDIRKPSREDVTEPDLPDHLTQVSLMNSLVRRTNDCMRYVAETDSWF